MLLAVGSCSYCQTACLHPTWSMCSACSSIHRTATASSCVCVMTSSRNPHWLSACQALSLFKAHIDKWNVHVRCGGRLSVGRRLSAGTAGVRGSAWPWHVCTDGRRVYIVTTQRSSPECSWLVHRPGVAVGWSTTRHPAVPQSLERLDDLSWISLEPTTFAVRSRTWVIKTFEICFAGFCYQWLALLAQWYSDSNWLTFLLMHCWSTGTPLACWSLFFAQSFCLLLVLNIGVLMVAYLYNWNLYIVWCSSFSPNSCRSFATCGIVWMWFDRSIAGWWTNNGLIDWLKSVQNDCLTPYRLWSV